MVDIELTNFCNFNCKMCPTGNGMTRKRGFMTGNVFYLLLTQLEKHKTPLRLIRWGEPTLHPDLYDYISDARQAGLPVHLNTNGMLLKISEVLDSGLNSIKFSFQGTDKEEYYKWRGTDFFDDLCEKIADLYCRKGRPFITVGTTITDETLEQVSFFTEKMSKICDRVIVDRTRDLTEPPSSYRNCPEVWNRLSVDWDGLVTACCGDYDRKMIVGDAKDQPLDVIWKNDQISHYRHLLKNMRHAEIDLCRNCAR
jgi:radical SAM protein with 4Fe4S-binding SPASM domain